MRPDIPGMTKCVIDMIHIVLVGNRTLGGECLKDIQLPWKENSHRNNKCTRNVQNLWSFKFYAVRQKKIQTPSPEDQIAG